MSVAMYFHIVRQHIYEMHHTRDASIYGAKSCSKNASLVGMRGVLVFFFSLPARR